MFEIERKIVTVACRIGLPLATAFRPLAPLFAPETAYPLPIPVSPGTRFIVFEQSFLKFKRKWTAGSKMQSENAKKQEIDRRMTHLRWIDLGMMIRKISETNKQNKVEETHNENETK